MNKKILSSRPSNLCLNSPQCDIKAHQSSRTTGMEDWRTRGGAARDSVPPGIILQVLWPSRGKLTFDSDFTRLKNLPSVLLVRLREGTLNVQTQLNGNEMDLSQETWAVAPAFSLLYSVSMGNTSSLSLGVSISNYKHRVWCGDCSECGRKLMSNDTTYQELNYLLSDYCVPGPVRGAGHVEMENAEAVPILI